MDEALIRFKLSLFMGLLFILIGLNFKDFSLCFVPGSLMTSGAMIYLCLMKRQEIPFKTIVLKKPEECIICLDTIDRGAKLDCICKYFYHERCIRQWFQEKQECPICKKVFNIP